MLQLHHDTRSVKCVGPTHLVRGQSLRVERVEELDGVQALTSLICRRVGAVVDPLLSDDQVVV